MNVKKLPKMCKCGKPMHLTDNQKFMIMHSGKNWAERRRVQGQDGKLYSVPIYYIIAHGLRNLDTSLFKEIKQ